MKKCPKCAEMLQTEAKVCRYCGYEFGLSKDSKGCLTTAAILIGLAIIAGRCDTKKSPERIAIDKSIEARFRIERAVKARLRDPDSAQFKHLRNGCGYVNSRNGFGGMVGDTPFIAGAKGVAFRDDGPKAFAELWNSYCVKGLR